MSGMPRHTGCLWDAGILSLKTKRAEKTRAPRETSVQPRCKIVKAMPGVVRRGCAMLLPVVWGGRQACAGAALSRGVLPLDTLCFGSAGRMPLRNAAPGWQTLHLCATRKQAAREFATESSRAGCTEYFRGQHMFAPPQSKRANIAALRDKYPLIARRSTPARNRGRPRAWVLARLWSCVPGARVVASLWRALVLA